MGYNSYVTGDLTIRPALPDGLIDAAGFGEDGDMDLILRTEGDETVGIKPDGSIGIVGESHTHATVRHEDSYKAYDLQDHVQYLAQLCAERGCAIDGKLMIYGEEDRDIWRLRIVARPEGGGGVIQETPRLLWPNGDTEDL